MSLNDKDNCLIINYDFDNDWHIKLKLEEIYGEDNLKNNDIPCVISRKSYGIVEDCGGDHSLMQIAKIQDLKTVNLSCFDKNELNNMLLSNMSYFQILYQSASIKAFIIYYLSFIPLGFSIVYSGKSINGSDVTKRYPTTHFSDQFSGSRT